MIDWQIEDRLIDDRDSLNELNGKLKNDPIKVGYIV
jgi:hypothetical protein